MAIKSDTMKVKTRKSDIRCKNLSKSAMVWNQTAFKLEVIYRLFAII